MWVVGKFMEGVEGPKIVVFDPDWSYAMGKCEKNLNTVTFSELDKFSCALKGA